MTQQLRAVWYDRLPTQTPTRAARLYDVVAFPGKPWQDTAWRLVLNEDGMQLDDYCGTEEAAFRLFEEFKRGQLTIRSFVRMLTQEIWESLDRSEQTGDQGRKIEADLLDKCRRGEPLYGQHV